MNGRLKMTNNKALLGILLVVALLIGCAGMSTGERTVAGGAIGAGAGAGVAALAGGNPWVGAGIGAGVGALTGYLTR
jgi:hypothetical protein